MANDLRFDGRVAIVTGAGGGLGRSHALLLGKRGARVVVNDLGGSMRGGGQSTTPAQAVVDEIKAAGGDAVANFDSVEDGAKIVQCAMDTWGRIDIVVNNAGILRDTSFQKLGEEDWDLVYRVHVLGGFRVTRAAWNHMRDAGYGRVVFTASAAGIYGNFGQANYAMAKLGLVGLSNTLAIEGRKRGVLVNTIAPIAGSRLTETVLPKELLDALRPEYVSPLVAVLCHESSTETGGLFEVGGGYYAKLRWERTVGKKIKLGKAIEPEALAAAWPEITSFEKTDHPADITSSMAPVIENIGSKSRGGNEFIDVDAALGYEFPPLTTEYTERDLALYALGVGAGTDPLDVKDLQYVYELHGDGFRTLPTYSVVPVINSILEHAKQGKQAPGLSYGFDRILHGEQYTEAKRPLPAHQKLVHKTRIANIWDKGKHAVVVFETRSYDEADQELAYNEITMVVRGAGGWGGDRGPSGDGNAPPERAPDAVVEQKINADQALLYRLSGDWNPLHADPAFAQAFGFPRPILHGLCTYGFAARHVVKAFAGNDARLFKAIRARFADSVFPGETLVTEMWKETPQKIVFRSTVKERNKVAISHASVELYTEVPVVKAAPKAAAAPAPAADDRSAAGRRRRARGARQRRHLRRHPRLHREERRPRRQGGHGLPVPPQGPRQRVDGRRQERQGRGHCRERRGGRHAGALRRRLPGHDLRQGRRAEALHVGQAQDQRQRDGVAEADVPQEGRSAGRHGRHREGSRRCGSGCGHRARGGSAGRGGCTGGGAGCEGAPRSRHLQGPRRASRREPRPRLRGGGRAPRRRQGSRQRVDDRPHRVARHRERGQGGRRRHHAHPRRGGSRGAGEGHPGRDPPPARQAAHRRRRAARA